MVCNFTGRRKIVWRMDFCFQPSTSCCWAEFWWSPLTDSSHRQSWEDVTRRTAFAQPCSGLATFPWAQGCCLSVVSVCLVQNRLSGDCVTKYRRTTCMWLVSLRNTCSKFVKLNFQMFPSFSALHTDKVQQFIFRKGNLEKKYCWEGTKTQDPKGLNLSVKTNSPSPLGIPMVLHGITQKLWPRTTL